MRVIGKEDLLEPLNRAALRDRPGGRRPATRATSWPATSRTPTSGTPRTPPRQAEVRGMFEEMVGWAVEGGADMIIGETFYYAGEALAALEVAKATGLPVVLTIAPMAMQEMADGIGIVETCQRLEQAGADVVGMNCFRGPETMLPWLKQIRAAVSCHVGATADPLPDHRRGTDVLQPQRRPRKGALAARPHLPDRAGPAVRQPVRDRRLRQGGPRPRHQLPRRLLRRLAHAGPRDRGGGREVPPRPAGSRRTCATTSCTATTSGYPSTSSRSATRPSQTRNTKVPHERDFCESGRQDLNLRPPGPQPGALPDCATPRGAPASERATGIEPALRAWKAPVQPQHFARKAPTKRT